MILPTKGISSEAALLTVGARLLALLNEPKTVSRVWEELSRAAVAQQTVTFDWFVLALDMLYAMGLLEFDHGRLYRCQVEEGAL